MSQHSSSMSICCSEDVKARIARAKKATMELDTIWKDRGIRKELKMKLVKALIWPVITYGAEGWTLKKEDERRLEAAEMWGYRRMLRISWTEKRTNKSILNELQTRRELRRGKEEGGVLGCNTLITSRNGQGHPWKKTWDGLKIELHGGK